MLARISSLSPYFLNSMDDKLRKILDDLYQIEPSLKTQELELVALIKKLLATKPETTFDQQFAKKLRTQLLQQQKSTTNLMPTSPFLFQRLAYVTIGGLLTLIVAVPLTYQLAQPGTTLESLVSSPNTEPKFRELTSNAFGTLSLESTTSALSDESTRSAVAPGTNTVPAGAGGGSGVTSEDADKQAAGLSIDPYPGSNIYYHYTYNGEDIDLSTISDTVYRRNGGIALGGRGSDLTGAKVGPVDLGAFSGLSLQSFSLKQGDKNGYSVYVDPENGSLSINGNEGLWGYTKEYIPFTEGEVLPDEELLSIASDFLNRFRIDTSGFGEPSVDNRGLVYALTQPANLRYIPEVVNVTYPLLLDGQAVYSSDGSAYGMTLMINMRTKAVGNAYMNIGEAYDRSTYELERSAETVLAYAAQGGIYHYEQPADATVVEIELGTPQLILMSHYNYTGSTVENLFVPALSFPITKNSDTNPVYQTTITVPLVKSIIDEAQKSNPDVQILEAQTRDE